MTRNPFETYITDMFTPQCDLPKLSCTTHTIVTSGHLTIRKMPHPYDFAVMIWLSI